jgi:hypothetical protein
MQSEFFKNESVTVVEQKKQRGAQKEKIEANRCRSVMARFLYPALNRTLIMTSEG